MTSLVTFYVPQEFGTRPLYSIDGVPYTVTDWCTLARKLLDAGHDPEGTLQVCDGQGRPLLKSKPLWDLAMRRIWEDDGYGIRSGWYDPDRVAVLNGLRKLIRAGQERPSDEEQGATPMAA